jgi:hypothetical protein
VKVLELIFEEQRIVTKLLLIKEMLMINRIVELLRIKVKVLELR